MKKFGEIVMLEVFALLLLFVGTLWAGSIYKWVDENGVVSYSNVAPPEDEADVGVIEETPEDQNQKISAGVGGDNPPPETVSPDIKNGEEIPGGVAQKIETPRDTPAKQPGAVSTEEPMTEDKMKALEEAAKDSAIKDKPLREKYLTQKIEKTKQSIEEIEKLLRKRPDDEALRRTLKLRREYLRKYTQAAKTGSY